MERSITGLERLCQESTWQKKIKGNVAYLCHQASVDSNYNWGPALLQKLLGKRLVALWGPQHGLVTNVQDNMIESPDFIHPYFKIPVYSLYSHTRAPTPQMLQNIDTLIVDLQDVGTRVYTYIWTLSHIMESCAGRDINLVILDRPNPVNGLTIEGNLLDLNFSSFVGRLPLPMRHAMTIGEVALFFKKHYKLDCQLEIIPMENWQRIQYFDQTGLPWILPSPNLPNSESALEQLTTLFAKEKLSGCKLRPIYFLPMFQKHMGVGCGGVQIHVANREHFAPWKVGQYLCKFLYHHLESNFSWKSPPYEYEYEKLPIDLINGTDKIRNWIEKNGSMEELLLIENYQLDNFLNLRQEILIYR